MWPIPEWIEWLILSNNKISCLGEAFEKLTNLKNLDISHNQVNSCPGIQNLNKLQILNASYNEVLDNSSYIL